MVHCWCGNTDLIPFAASYLKCNVCETIVAAELPEREVLRVNDDRRDFYGRHYWFSYQEKDLGHPDILTRSRTDLPERCLHWFRALLKYKTPPAKVLEMGSAHGGFVALLRWAGYDAFGLELSPWVVDFASRTFDVPMLLGPIEDQAIDPGSLDVIALMDVLEHLPDPIGTIQYCLSLLGPTGFLIIQTPRYPERKTYDEMAAQDDPFLKMLKKKDHLYLFSQQSIRHFFHRLAVEHLVFEPAIFSQYDMFFVASRAPLTVQTQESEEKSLSAAPGGRMIQALLDLYRQIQALEENYTKLAADSAARLEVIEVQGSRLGELEGERNNLRAEVEGLRRSLQFMEADLAARLEAIQEIGLKCDANQAECEARLKVIQDLALKLDVSEANSVARLEVIHDLALRLDATEANSAARLEAIHDLGLRLDASEANSAARLEVIQVLGEKLQAANAVIEQQKHEIERRAEQLEQVRNSLELMKLSRSWRITAPLRWVHNQWNNIFEKLGFT